MCSELFTLAKQLRKIFEMWPCLSSQAIKDEVIVDLVYRCRSNQKKLMQMLATTGSVTR